MAGGDSIELQFYDPFTLAQVIREDLREHDEVFELGLVVLPTVTKAAIESAITHLPEAPARSLARSGRNPGKSAPPAASARIVRPDLEDDAAWSAAIKNRYARVSVELASREPVEVLVAEPIALPLLTDPEFADGTPIFIPRLIVTGSVAKDNAITAIERLMSGEDGFPR
jgi:hypothetical protein